MRNVVAGLVAVLVLAAMVGTGWWLLEGGLADDEPGEAPEATLDAYLDAWEAGNHQAMSVHVRQPGDAFLDVHAQLAEAIGTESLEAAAGEVVEPQDGRATAPVRLRWDVDYADELAWDIEVELQRSAGEWAVVWDHTTVHPQLQPGLRFDVQTTSVERAPILAADGSELAGGGDRLILGFEPTAVEDADELAEAFERAVEGTGDRAASELARDDLVDDWFYPVVELSSQRGEDAWEELQGVPGALRQSDEGRTLIDEDFALHVTGRVDEATAEQLEQLGPPYEVGDEVGQFGLEAAFERDLVGSDEVTLVLRDGDDGPVRETLLEYQADAAQPLQTTIDVEVQRAVEDALVGVETTAALVVVDAEDGAIRASASRPLTGYNRAFEGRYPPGSTFKLVTLEAALAEGWTPEDEIGCPGETSVHGLGITNAGDLDLGTTTLRRAFAESCNTTFAPLGVELGWSGVGAAAERFGFGWEPEDLGLVAAGGVAEEPGDDAALGAAAFGQARVTASPLHMASVAAAAESGAWHAPFLLADRDPGESRELADGTLEPLRDLLREAVADGTGTEADTHPEARGKTGTAEADGDVEHAWFIGTFEGLGFAVLVEEGGAGGRAAAPIAGRLVSELDVRLGGPDDGTDQDEDPGDADDG